MSKVNDQITREVDIEKAIEEETAIIVEDAIWFVRKHIIQNIQGFTPAQMEAFLGVLLSWADEVKISS